MSRKIRLHFESSYRVHDQCQGPSDDIYIMVCILFSLCTIHTYKYRIFLLFTFYCFILFVSTWLMKEGPGYRRVCRSRPNPVRSDPTRASVRGLHNVTRIRAGRRNLSQTWSGGRNLRLNSDQSGEMYISYPTGEDNIYLRPNQMWEMFVSVSDQRGSMFFNKDQN